MWKAALAGAVALATVGTLSVSQQGVGVTPAAAEVIVVTEGQIAQLHKALVHGSPVMRSAGWLCSVFGRLPGR